MTFPEINLKFLKMWQPRNPHKGAAGEMYIELLTRILTQNPLPVQSGDEQAPLNSVYSLFSATREIIRRHGRACGELTKLAVVVLNQIVRPFTARWPKLTLAGAFQDIQQCQQFRFELIALQEQLKKYQHTGKHG